jgi:hypothetical protein
MKKIIWAAALGLVALAGQVAAQVVEAPQAAAAGQQAPPQYTPDQLDQLVGSIALYPDPLLAQLLPASTYPLDIVRAARAVQGGMADADIDQQNWDPSVRAIAHYRTVLEFMDSNLDWTQELGQAFVVQPQDVMEAVQRMRQMAAAQGNLQTTPQQQIVTEDNAIAILPAQPDVVYVPVYQPAVVYYQPAPVYGPLITFGVGWYLGPWLTLDCDWTHWYVYTPGWTWNHWHDHYHDEHGHAHFDHPADIHAQAWHRDEHRPLVLPGRRMTPARAFDDHRGDTHAGERASPMPQPTWDRGRTGQDRSTRGEAPGSTPQVERNRGRGNQSLGAPSQPPATTPSRVPAPAAPSRPSAPAPAAPRPAPSQPRPSPAQQPARVSPPPVHVAPPPPTRSAPVMTGPRPSVPSPNQSVPERPTGIRGVGTPPTGPSGNGRRDH